MVFNFTNKNGQSICKIEARDKLAAKSIYKQMEKNGEISIPINNTKIEKL